MLCDAPLRVGLLTTTRTAAASRTQLSADDAACVPCVVCFLPQGPWIARQALHALALTLQHPDSGGPVTFVAPPPDDFVAAAAALELTLPSDDELVALAWQLTDSSSTET